MNTYLQKQWRPKRAQKAFKSVTFKSAGNHIPVLCLASSSFLITMFLVKKMILRKISQSNLLKEAIVGILRFFSICGLCELCQR